LTLLPGDVRLAQKMLDSNVVSIDQAIDIIAGHLRKPGTELVPIRQANHRVVANEISPCLDHPQGDVALVDGFALEASQTEGASEGSPAIFTVVGEVRIGETPGFSLRRGECASVSTGCLLPEGGDAVIAIEEIGETGQQIKVKRRLSTGEHVAPTGSVFRKQTRVVGRGCLIDAAVVSLMAAMGIDRVAVYSKIKVGLMATGREIRSRPSTDFGLGSVLESSTWLLEQMLEPLCEVIHSRPARDHFDDFADGLASLSDCQLIILTGGTGPGSGDRVVDWLSRAGTRLDFLGLDSAPGRHVKSGSDGRRCFVCLPGKPVGCFILAHILLRPVLARVLEAPELSLRRFTAVLRGQVEGSKARHTWMLGHLQSDFSVSPVVTSSGLDVVALTSADCLLHIPQERCCIKDGERLDVYPLTLLPSRQTISSIDEKIEHG